MLLSFSICRKNKNKDITSFLEFVLKGAVESLKEVKKYISNYIKKSALDKYYEDLREEKKITKRQLDLLKLLLSSKTEEMITIPSIQKKLPFRALYAKVSDRTARRDLDKLKSMNLLKSQNSSFQLDREILNAL